MADSKESQQVVSLERVTELLSGLQDEIASKRATIRSYDDYSKETFLAFDSYNLGLATAMEMVGKTVCAIQDLPKE